MILNKIISSSFTRVGRIKSLLMQKKKKECAGVSNVLFYTNVLNRE
jgi:hypothetical protein